MRLRADRDGARTPRVIWLVTALFGCLLLLYSILFPSYRGPDEPQQVDLVLQVQETWRYPDSDGRFIAQSIIDTLDVVSFHSRSRDLKAGDASLRSSRPPLMALTPVSSQRNHLTQHPPLYYYTLAVISEAVDIFTPGDALSRPFDMTVWILRLGNVLLLLPVPAITYHVVRRLGARHEAGVAAAVMLLGIPQFTHIGAVVNNDNLLVLLVAALTLLLVRIARGELSTRTSLVTGVVAGLALLTKASALFLPVWIGFAYLLCARQRKLSAPAVRGFALAGGSAAVIGGWWWIRNLIVHGSPLTGALATPASVGGDFTADPFWWSQRFVAWITRRFWGWFGWFDVELPLWAVLLGVALVFVGAALMFFDRRNVVGGSRVTAAFLLFPTVIVGGLVAVGAYRGYLNTGDTPSIQGRYLFPGVAGLAAVTMLGIQNLFRRVDRLSVFSVLFAAVMQVAGVITALHFYWAPRGAGSLWGEARSMIAWSPWPGELSVALGLALLGFGAWVVHEIFDPSPVD